ncbi:zinc transporter 11-like isoform X2 [Cornus florida]|uniref:zinc transporter 11-like isoform X2 n=1 Tax=Cornus florida TaxID=4283 RepID=UPI0028A092DE|nr:zinc transporter 11-like isoform X2 [Cornus florida]
MPPSLLLFILLLLSASAHGGADADPLPAEPPDLRSKSLILVKIWSLILVFVVTFTAGVSPYLMKWNQGFVVLGTQFAGGVFLGTALMDFLSDSNEAFQNLTSKHYPFAFMLASVGYLLTMLANCIVLHIHRKRTSSGIPLQGSVQRRKPSSDVGTSQSQIQVDNGTDDYVEASFFYDTSFWDTVLLIIGLSFHSVFEGIAIGVADTKARAWRALWTVSLHKVFAAIAMGTAVLHSIPDYPLMSCVAYAFAFAISSPIGVTMGIVIDATTQGIVADWICGISLGLACGVFIYVSANHLLSKGHLPQRRVSVDTPQYKFLSALSGVGVIAVVMIWDT